MTTAGEQWAAAELDALRRAGFSPDAVATFLRRSSQRAAEVRRDRPALARRARRWELAGALAYAAVAARHRHGPRRVAGTAGWWTTTCLMLDWHLGMVESGDGTPRNLNAADALTLSRAWLVPSIATGDRPQLVLLAAVTDALDGVVARATSPTRAGRDLEGLADLAVAAAALTRAWRQDAVARHVLALELLRVHVGFAYGVTVYFARAAPPSPVILRAGRAATPLRVAGLVAAAAGRRRPADALLTAGSVLSLGLLAAALRGGSR